MEEQSIGELPQHGRSLGVYDPSRGTMSDVGSSQIKRSGPLAAAEGLELNGNQFLTLITDKSNRWGSSTGRDTMFLSTK